MNYAEILIDSFQPLDESHATQIVHTLTAKKQTLATAESLTGGAIGAAVTSVSGASSVYLGGIISYTNQVKEDILHVSAEILRTYDAVSPECAREMAENCRQIFQSDYALAATGFAGPDGGNKSYPVGTVFIALSTKNGITVQKLFFTCPKRAEVREMTADFALKLLREQL